MNASSEERAQAREKEIETARAFLDELAVLAEERDQGMAAFGLGVIRDRVNMLRIRPPETPEGWLAAVEAIDEIAARALRELPFPGWRRATRRPHNRSTPQEG